MDMRTVGGMGQEKKLSKIEFTEKQKIWREARFKLCQATDSSSHFRTIVRLLWYKITLTRKIKDKDVEQRHL